MDTKISVCDFFRLDNSGMMKSSKPKPSNLKLKRNAKLFLKENSFPTTEMDICLPNDSEFENDYPSQDSTSSKQEMLAKVYGKARHSNFALSQFDLNDPVMKEIYCERFNTLSTNRRKQKSRSKQNVVRVINRKTASKLFITEEEYKELLQLQTNRNVGMYAMCDDCDKMRYLAQIKDPLELPIKWYCGNINVSCSWDEMLLNPEEAKDLIYNKYSPGSIVFGKIEGYPWWPAIVNDDPVYRAYYKLSKTDNFNPVNILFNNKNTIAHFSIMFIVIVFYL